MLLKIDKSLYYLTIKANIEYMDSGEASNDAYGSMIEYNADVSRLLQYIEYLESLLNGDGTGTPNEIDVRTSNT